VKVDVEDHQRVDAGIAEHLANAHRIFVRSGEGSEALAALTSAGGVLIIGIRLKLLALKDVRVGNFLPALVLAPALVGLVSLF
jgi:uncharacterized membrane protein YqgA involved in biofilm formation